MSTASASMGTALSRLALTVVLTLGLLAGAWPAVAQDVEPGMDDPACAAADLSAPACTETATPIEPDPAVRRSPADGLGSRRRVGGWEEPRGHLLDGRGGLLRPAQCRGHAFRQWHRHQAPDRHSRRCRGSPLRRVGTAVLHHGDARGSTHQQRGLTRRSCRPQAGELAGRGQAGDAEAASSASSCGRGRGAFSSPRWLQIQRAASCARRTDRARPRSSTR